MEFDFTKFPSTPHLLWLGNGSARDDKHLSSAEAEEFLSGPVIVEEKVDGANLGISFDRDGNLLIQNRGNFILRGAKGQFAPLWFWLTERESALFDTLDDRFILFGEWCYAQHSIPYTRLPDWFLAFDVYDKRQKLFLTTETRNEMVRRMQLRVVPEVARGIFAIGDIPHMIGLSSLYDGPMEGVYLRSESQDCLAQRAKVVRAEFIQKIGAHWSKRDIIPNLRLPVQV